jgi:hypothetical protein
MGNNRPRKKFRPRGRKAARLDCVKAFQISSSLLEALAGDMRCLPLARLLFRSEWIGACLIAITPCVVLRMLAWSNKAVRVNQGLDQVKLIEYQELISLFFGFFRLPLPKGSGETDSPDFNG